MTSVLDYSSLPSNQDINRFLV